MASVLDLVKHYQNVIETNPQDEQKVLKAIDKLYNLDVKVQHLQDTGVGRTVNALRKEPEMVGKAARALVYKWKLMVASEASDHEDDHDDDSPTQNGHGKDSDDDHPSQSISNKDHKHINGNHSGKKKKYHSSEEDEPERKKSRYSASSDDDYKRKTIQPKIEPQSDSPESHSESDEESEFSEEKTPELKIEPEDKPSSSSSKHAYSNYNQHIKSESSSKRSHESSERNSSRNTKYNSESRHSSEKSLKSSHSSKDKHSKDKEYGSDKKHKDHKLDKDRSKEKEELKSSKHSSEKQKSSSHKTENKSDKHISQEKSKPDKHHSSSKSDKERHKSSSEKEVSDKHRSIKESSKSKERSSSNKESSSSKEKSKDKSSSKDKERSRSSSHNKSEKKSSNDKSNRDKSKSDSSSKSEKSRNSDRSAEKKSSHKSSSSEKSQSSSSKSKEDKPKKTVTMQTPQIQTDSDDDGIGCESGASFAEALGSMVVPVKTKKKTATTPIKDAFSPGAPRTPPNDLSPAALLAPTTKLAPLPALEISALPEISPNYKPRPPPKFIPHFTEEELGAAITSKNQRTKVYSGNKILGKVPSLYEMCVQILQEHIDALEYTGGVPYEILKPVIDKATPQQLFMLEHYNPYLLEDTDHLWHKYVEKHFRNKKRQEMETWREMYMRCQEEQENKLKSLTANIRMTQEAKKAPIKQTKMAYVDTVVKPPRNIARKQAMHGTAHVATASPAARVAALAAAPNVLRGGARAAPAHTPSAGSFTKPKKAPLMAKALQLMRGRKR